MSSTILNTGKGIATDGDACWSRMKIHLCSLSLSHMNPFCMVDWAEQDQEDYESRSSIKVEIKSKQKQMIMSQEALVPSMCHWWHRGKANSATKTSKRECCTMMCAFYWIACPENCNKALLDGVEKLSVCQNISSQYAYDKGRKEQIGRRKLDK